MKGAGAEPWPEASGSSPPHPGPSRRWLRGGPARRSTIAQRARRASYGIRVFVIASVCIWARRVLVYGECRRCSVCGGSAGGRSTCRAFQDACLLCM